MAGRGTDIVLGGAIEPQILQDARRRVAAADRERRAQIAQDAQRVAGAATTRSSPPAGCTSSAPSATSRGASTTSCAAAPAARATRARRASTCRSRIRCCASSAASVCRRIMQRLKMPEGEPIEHPIVNRSIAKAQNRVESRNFDIRKQLLEYDDVANDQRRVIYQQRNELLEASDVSETDPQHDRGADRGHGARCTSRRNRSRSSGTFPALEIGARRRLSARGACRRVAQGRARAHRRERCAIALREAALETVREQAGRRSAPRSFAQVRAQPHAADGRPALARAPRRARSPAAGASTCAATRRRIRSRSTSARRSSCSPTCSTASSRTSSRSCSPCRSARQRTCRRSRSAPPVSNVRYQHADYEEALAAAPLIRRHRRRRGRAAAVHARWPEGRAQRSVPVRVGEEVQALPRPTLNAVSRREVPAASLFARCFKCLPAAVSMITALRVESRAGRSLPPNRCRSTTRRRRPSSCCPLRGVALGHRRGRDQELDARRRPAGRAWRRERHAAGVFTQNRFCAAPVIVCREHLRATRRDARSSINAGNANAGTGDAESRPARADLRGGGEAARLRAGGSAAVLDRRDHGAAAG